MNIIFIGAGYVGLITCLVLAKKNKRYKFWCLDINEEKINKLKDSKPHFFEPGLEKLVKNVKNVNYISNYDKDVINNADIIFICVETPTSNLGEWNLNYLYNSIDTIFNIDTNADIVIKSTVPVGTCSSLEKYIENKYKKKINILSNPEFLSQGTAINDTLKPNRIIIGHTNKLSIKNISKLYSKFKNVLYMSRESSEMSKISANNFLAMKLSFINEISNICRVNNISVYEVIESMKYDDRIGNKYMEPGLGFGGSCLPKDSLALYNWSLKNGYDAKLIRESINLNEEQKRIFFNFIKEKFKDKNIKIGVLGLSFKSKTDDVRYSASIKTIELLLEDDYKKIFVYDPIAMENTNKIFGKKIVYCNNFSNIFECDLVLIFNDCKEFYKINNFSNKNMTILNSVKKIKINRNNFKEVINLNN